MRITSDYKIKKPKGLEAILVCLGTAFGTASFGGGGYVKGEKLWENSGTKCAAHPAAARIVRGRLIEVLHQTKYAKASPVVRDKTA